MTVLVTGANGHLGRLVIDQLIARGLARAEIVAGVRSPEKAADLAEAGVSVARLDYDDPASVGAALEGIDKVLLISGTDFGNRVAQHTAVVEAARAEGVKLLAYTSASKADSSDFVLAPEHGATERIIAESGIPFVMLRNVWYVENYQLDAERAREAGEFAAAAGEGRVAAASRLDYAEAAAVVLLEEGHEGKVYELAGDAVLNYQEIAQAIGEAIGREVVYRQVSPEELAAGLTAAGVDPGFVGVAVAIDQGIAQGALDIEDHTLAELIGRPTTPFADALRAGN
ncbi:MAG: SDR family oxidoreductase [Leucobacter sp.]